MILTEADKQELLKQFDGLTPEQVAHLRAILTKFHTPIQSVLVNAAGSPINGAVVTRMGVRLLAHHANSGKPMAKVLVEHALNDSFREAGINSMLHTSGTNPGWDMQVEKTTIALKTQADNVREDKIHISKWMELGRGDWVPQTQHDRFLEHLSRYDTIWMFRCLSKADPIRYELVEIPKRLFTDYPTPNFVVKPGKSKARQDSPSATAKVTDAKGQHLYDICHDGGEEKKLTIRSLDKNQCIVRATWEF